MSLVSPSDKTDNAEVDDKKSAFAEQISNQIMLPTSLDGSTPPIIMTQERPELKKAWVQLLDMVEGDKIYRADVMNIYDTLKSIVSTTNADDLINKLKALTNGEKIKDSLLYNILNEANLSENPLTYIAALVKFVGLCMNKANDKSKSKNDLLSRCIDKACNALSLVDKNFYGQLLELTQQQDYPTKFLVYFEIEAENKKIISDEQFNTAVQSVLELMQKKKYSSGDHDHS